MPPHRLHSYRQLARINCFEGMALVVNGTVAQTGEVLNGDWSAVDPTSQLTSLIEVVRWPDALKIQPTDTVAIAAGTNVQPLLLTIKQFPPSIASDGTPLEDPTYELDCTTSDFVHDQSGYLLRFVGDTWTISPGPTEGLPEARLSWSMSRGLSLVRMPEQTRLCGPRGFFTITP